MSAPIEFLDLDDLLRLAERLLGSPVPVRDVGLLGAAARPQAPVFGEDAYPDVWTKAAALLQSIVKNHPLIDGNRRLGWLATAVFLELNEVAASGVSNDDVYDMVVAVAAVAHDVDEIAVLLRSAIEANYRASSPCDRRYLGSGPQGRDWCCDDSISQGVGGGASMEDEPCVEAIADIPLSRIERYRFPASSELDGSAPAGPQDSFSS